MTEMLMVSFIVSYPIENGTRATGRETMINKWRIVIRHKGVSKFLH
jgi:hypothetical protein